VELVFAPEHGERTPLDCHCRVARATRIMSGGVLAKNEAPRRVGEAQRNKKIVDRFGQSVTTTSEHDEGVAVAHRVDDSPLDGGAGRCVRAERASS
jgi:hypothetical protein